MRKLLLFLPFLLGLCCYGQVKSDTEIFYEAQAKLGDAALMRPAEVIKQQDMNDYPIVRNLGESLTINNEIIITKGTEARVFLPAETDFVFIRRKQNALSAKLIGDVAGIVGTGATAVGLGSNNLGTMRDAVRVMQTTSAIQYGADAINQIENLPISKRAKKMAGKQFIVESWELTEDGYLLHGTIEKKKYEVFLEPALYIGELKF